MRHARLMCAGAVLLSTLAASRGANCTAKFEGLGTCAVLNGVPATGTAAQLDRQAVALIDEAAAANYVLDRWNSGVVTESEALTTGFYADGYSSGMSDSQACWDIHTKFHCVLVTSERVTADPGAAYKFAAPCNGTGGRMLPCYEWCVEFFSLCVPGLPRRYRTDICNMHTTPRAASCFGSNGIYGMKQVGAPGTPKSGANALQDTGSMALLVIPVIYYLSH